MTRRLAYAHFLLLVALAVTLVVLSMVRAVSAEPLPPCELEHLVPVQECGPYQWCWTIAD